MKLSESVIFYKKQILASAIANVLSYLIGIAVASSSVVIARLSDGEAEKDGGLKITDEQGSWIASSLCFGQLFSCLINGHIIESLGLRRSMSLAAIIFSIALTGQALASNVFLICAARFLLGNANMVSSMIIQPFICEISNPRLRSLTTSFWLLSYSLGFSSMFLFGAILPWRVAVGFPAVIALLALIGFQFIHDSPARLLLHSQMEEARKAAEFYKINYTDELQDMEKHRAKTESQDKKSSDNLFIAKFRRFRNSVCDPSFFKPMGLLFFTTVAIEWSSFPILGFYMVTVFKLTGSPIDPFWASSIVGGTRLVAAISATGLLSHFKWRQLYLTSAFSLAIIHLSMGLYTYLNISGYLLDLDPATIKILEWTPLILVMLMYLDFAMGFGNIPYILLGEILPQESCSLGNSLIFISQNSFSISMTKSAPAIIDSIGIFGIFFLFACVAFSSGVFAAIFMPETKGLSLKEIRQIYDHKTCQTADLEALDNEEEDKVSIKWAGARGRRGTNSITI